MGFLSDAISSVGDFVGLDDMLESPDPEMRQASHLTPQQQKLFKSMLERVIDEFGQGVQAYPGAMVPGTNNLLEDLMAKAGGYAQSPLYTAGSDVLERALTASPDYDSTRQYWQESFVDPAMQMFEQDILPSIREKNVGQGTFRSGGRYRAETGAAGDLMTNLTGQLANLMFNEQQSTRDRAMQAVPMGAAHSGQLMDVLRQTGMLERGIEGEELGEGYQKWMQEQPYSNPWLQYALPLVGQRSFENYMYQPQDPWYTALAKTGVSALGSSLAGQPVPYGGGGGGGGASPLGYGSGAGAYTPQTQMPGFGMDYGSMLSRGMRY